MQTRDKLNSFEYYIKIIDFMRDNINEWQNDIVQAIEDEYNGIQRYPNSNAEIIKNSKYDITLFQEKILLSTYSSGLIINDFISEFWAMLDFMKDSWKHSGGYTTMLNMLSISIMLDLHEAQYILYEIFCDLERQKDFEIKDHLIDFLFYQCGFNNELYAHFMIAKPYALLKEVIELSKIDKPKAVNKLKLYLQKNWFSALKRQDLIQETHKSPHGTHCGYWSFESGALVKILGLDDSRIKDQQYYPYDLVHYKNS